MNRPDTSIRHYTRDELEAAFHPVDTTVVVPFRGTPPAVMQASGTLAAARTNVPSDWFDPLASEQKNRVLRHIMSHQAIIEVADTSGRDRGPLGCSFIDLMAALNDASHGGADEAYPIALEWAQTSKRFISQADFDKDWHSLKPKPGGITVGFLLMVAKKAGIDLSQWQSTPRADDATTVVSQEILPNQNEVSAAIEALGKQSDPDAIKAVLEKVAAARLGPLWEGSMLSRIKDVTEQGLRPLRAALNDAKRQLVSPRPQGVVTDWRADLILDDETKEPRRILANVVIALTGHPAWEGVLAVDDFTSYIMSRRQPPWPEGDFKPGPWTDADTLKVTFWAQTVANIHAPSHIVFEGVQAAAERVHFHPVRDYLGSLTWDEQPRIDGLFTKYYGALSEPPDDTEDEQELSRYGRLFSYYQAIGSRFLIGAVGRIYQPGCKLDCMPNLVGPQGTFKSSSLRALFDPWFTDEISDLGSKDAAMQAAGVWCVEISELAAAQRSTVQRVKAWLSRQSDRFRPPYGKAIKNQPRQCVAVGTTNDDSFLVDETGNRRSWAVRCGVIDIEKLKADRDQLWAEAVMRYRAGEQWWLHEPALIETAADVQAEFLKEDPWQNTVARLIHGQESVTINELMCHLGKQEQDCDQRDANRISRILKIAGWSRGWRKRPGSRVAERCYRPRVVNSIDESVDHTVDHLND